MLTLATWVVRVSPDRPIVRWFWVSEAIYHHMVQRATGVGLLALLMGFPVFANSGEAAEPQEYQAVIKQYCAGCHNDRLQTAGLTLEGLDLEHVGTGAETWEKVVRKLRAREMPPPRRPRGGSR